MAKQSTLYTVGTVVIILVVIATISVVLYKTDTIIAKFTVDVQSEKMTFLTAGQTKQFLEMDIDTYVSTMTRPDLVARKVVSSEEYIEAIVAAAAEFTNAEKSKLTECCKNADVRLLKLRSKCLVGFDVDKAAKIPWKLAKTDGRYEDGLPHTRTGIVFLTPQLIANSSTESLTTTLIHEKVHLYQRLNREDAQKFARSKNIMLFTEKQNFALARANPDTDGYIYTRNKEPMVALYKSDQPSGITDVAPQSGPDGEHPYELQAYEIAKMA
jgi:hypothetical protein